MGRRQGGASTRGGVNTLFVTFPCIFSSLSGNNLFFFYYG